MTLGRRGANNEMTNKIISHIHFYKELEEELVEVKFTEVKNFIYKILEEEKNGGSKVGRRKR